MSFNEWREEKLEDVIEFNPSETIKKGKVVKKIGMDKLMPFQRKIEGFVVTKYTSGTKFRNGDTLLARITPCLENGKTAQVSILEEGEVGFGSTEFIVLREKPGISDRNFIYYLSISPKLRDIAIKSMTGTSGRQRAQVDVIKNSIIKLPPIEEQRQIANILSSLDEKIEINNEINKKLEEMAQAIFKHWFVDFEFPNENGEPYKSSGGEMVESELGMIPKGWKIGSINDLGTIVSGGTPSKKKEEYYTEHGIPWITPKDLSLNKNRFISRGTIDITEEGLKNSSAKLMPKGTVLFSSRAPIGYIAIAKNEVSTNQGFKSIIPKNNIGSEFVYQFLKMNKEIIESRASGSTFKEISGGELKKIPAIIPSNNIIYRYNLITIKISSFIKNNEEELEKLRTIRDTLLPKLMSGEIRVPVEEEK
ncbi:restriction endonuclease subunit S [Caldifermentibacillus hisashii]|uniref:restriction endonuclease subunit S n=1 Tax=Caldifermentibacillus hisashii TaxID=996558 RepID=UPI0033676F04